MLFLLLLRVSFGVDISETGIFIQDVNVLEVGQRGSGFILILGSLLGILVVFFRTRSPHSSSPSKGQHLVDSSQHSI